MKSVNPDRGGRGSPDKAAAMMMGRVLKQVSRTVAADGLRASHFRLLAELSPSGTRITELSERLGMTKQGCGQFVRHLDGTGHVTVEVPADDARSRVVRRTPLGDRAAGTFVARMAALEDEWAARVGTRRYAAFRSVLTELVPPER